MKINNRGKRSFTAVDFLLILLIAVCIAGVAVRMSLGSGGLFSKDVRGEYIVSYVASGVDGEYSDSFGEGKVFYLDTGEEFGTLNMGAVFTPAKHYTEDSQGRYIAVYVNDGTVDVKGTALVKGTMTEGGFLLGGSVYIAANSQLTVSSEDLTVEITVTDIT